MARAKQNFDCTARDCLRKAAARRLCMMHYKRQHRGEPIDGYVAPIEAAPTICAARGCHDKPYARSLCQLHYWRWHSGERIDLDTGPMERDPIERALANAAEAARRREQYAARLAGCPLERAVEAGRFDARPRRWE